MRARAFWSALVLLGTTGCEAEPTSTRIERSVYNLLGGLEVGEMLMFSGAEAMELLLGGQPAARDFMYIPFHASESDGELALRLSGANVATPAALDATVPRFGDTSRLLGEPGTTLHERTHARMTDAARPMLSNRQVLSSLRNRPRLSIQGSLGGENAEVDQLVDINADSRGLFCQGIDVRVGRVEAISERVIVVGDTANPSGGFTRADYEAFAREFDQLIHPTVTEYFSPPTDIDDNGRVVVFFTAAVNEMSESEEDGFVGGFFWVRDLVPQVLGCPASNEGEIFFLLVPDPDGEASPIRHARDNVFDSAVATIAHEYQHLINAGRRLYINEAVGLETTWLDEGLGHAAEELLFYAATGLEPRSNISFEDLTTSAMFDAINRFMAQNLVRYGLYLEKITSESPTSGEDDLESRGATWAFLRYAADLSPLSDAEFFQLLVNSPQVGFDNLDSVLGRDAIDLVQDFGIGIYADDHVFALGQRFQQPSWNFRSLLPQFQAFSGFPLMVETLGPAEPLSMTLLAGTSGYVEVQGIGGEVAQVLATTAAGDAPSEQFRVAVIRTR